MKKILLYIWQFPQNIAGYFCSRKGDELLTEIDKEPVHVYFKPWFNAGVSLGNYVILDDKYYHTNIMFQTIRHEHGHQKQSLYFGPLYLIVIGLPSLIGNILSRIFKWDAKTYYSQPWEAWADKLGGVKR